MPPTTLALSGLSALALTSSYLAHVQGSLPERATTITPSGEGSPRGINTPATQQVHARLTVVLDIDETLCHTEFLSESVSSSLSQEQIEAMDARLQQSHNSFCFMHKGQLAIVRMRPHLSAFLSRASQAFDLVTFTAAEEEYAREVLLRIDPQKRFFSQSLFRQHCAHQGRVKDLRVLDRPLNRVVLVDNSYSSFLSQLSNGVPIASFTSDASDAALLVLWDFLVNLAHVPDVRNVLSSVFRLHDLLPSRH